MKLIMSVLDKADVLTVSDELEKQGYHSTVSDAKGGFLKDDKALMYIAVNAINVDAVLEIIKGFSQSREVDVKGGEDVRPPSVEVGGATVMVVDIERFEKLC